MIKQIAASWNRFWFSPIPVAQTTLPRMAICAVAAVWLATFLGRIDDWFGPQSWLSTSLAAKLIEFENTAAWQNWSLLWLADSTVICYGWLVSGIFIALLAGLGIGGRATLALLLFWIINWAHRIVWLGGLVEPALIACVAYLMVQPGVKPWQLGSTSTQTRSWTSRLTLRLLQTHWWILLAAGLLSQLASLNWWRGEAVWWLASAGRSHLLSVENLRGNATLTNALTHGIIVVEMLALWLITVPATRILGIGMGVVVSLIFGLIADQALYGLLLAACLLAFSWEFKTAAASTPE